MASETVLRDIKGGLVASTACVAYSIANGALIFSGTHQAMLARGIGAGLLTTAMVCLILAFTSGVKPVVATAGSSTTAPLGAILGTMAPALAALPPGAAVATIYAMVGVSTLCAGAVLLALGSGRLGKVVRFLPFPVIGGFMGTTGALLFLGSIAFGTGVPLRWQNLSQYLDRDVAIQLTATLIFAVLTTLFTRRSRNPLALPALLIITVTAVNLAVPLLHLSPDAPLLQSMFLVPRTPMPIAASFLFETGGLIDWSVIWPHWSTIAAYSLLVVMAVLLTSIGLESALNIDLDFDRELRAQGAAVIATGVAGGFTGITSVGSTLAGVASGAQGRATGLMAAAATFAVLWFGRPLLPFIPRFVIAGFLTEVGFWILLNWCVMTRRRMPFGEWALLIGIVAVTVWIGLVPAIILGILGGCVLLALDLSRVDIVRRVYGLNEQASPLVRSRDELAALAQEGSQVRCIELNGTLFFGSAYQILARIQRMLSEERPPATLVLDCTRVVGGDSSAGAILTRMRRLLADRQIKFAIVGARPSLLDLLRATTALRETDVVFADRNGALETLEDGVLLRSETLPTTPTFPAWLEESLGDKALAHLLMPYLEPGDFVAGQYLCREGDPTTTLLFIESGRVSVTVGRSGATEHIVRVFGPRTMTGEHGFILGKPRTANLRVDEPSRVWSLERRAFDRLSAEQPALVIALLRDIIGLQSERLAFATRQVAVLT